LSQHLQVLGHGRTADLEALRQTLRQVVDRARSLPQPHQNLAANGIRERREDVDFAHVARPGSRRWPSLLIFGGRHYRSEKSDVSTISDVLDSALRSAQLMLMVGGVILARAVNSHLISDEILAASCAFGSAAVQNLTGRPGKRRNT